VERQYAPVAGRGLQSAEIDERVRFGQPTIDFDQRCAMDAKSEGALIHGRWSSDRQGLPPNTLNGFGLELQPFMNAFELPPVNDWPSLSKASRQGRRRRRTAHGCCLHERLHVRMGRKSKTPEACAAGVDPREGTSGGP
jgi:hypothetical protein